MDKLFEHLGGNQPIVPRNQLLMDTGGNDKIVQIDDGSQVNLEMQAGRMVENLDGQHKNLKGKSIYYLTDLHSSQPAKGLQRYDRLARSYQITFCAYTIFHEIPDYVNSFSLRHDRTGELLANAISLTLIELSSRLTGGGYGKYINRQVV